MTVCSRFNKSVNGIPKTFQETYKANQQQLFKKKFEKKSKIKLKKNNNNNQKKKKKKYILFLFTYI